MRSVRLNLEGFGLFCSSAHVRQLWIGPCKRVSPCPVWLLAAPSPHPLPRSKPLWQPRPPSPKGKRPGNAAHRWCAKPGDPEPPGPMLHFPHQLPPNAIVFGKTSCDSDMRVPAWEGRQGTETAPLNTGTTVPPSTTKHSFPLWTNNVDNVLLKTRTSASARTYQCSERSLPDAPDAACRSQAGQDGTIPRQVQCLLASLRAAPPLPESPDGHAPSAPTAMLSFLPISMNAFLAVCALQCACIALEK